MCHGLNGDGTGKLGKALRPAPRNFACSDTMNRISAGQMFWVIKNGSSRTGMVAHKKSLGDNEILERGEIYSINLGEVNFLSSTESSKTSRHFFMF